MKKAILILLAAALLVPCLTGCSGGALKKVRVHEVTHSVFYAAQYIAMEKGYFADEGLEDVYKRQETPPFEIRSARRAECLSKPCRLHGFAAWLHAGTGKASPSPPQRLIRFQRSRPMCIRDRGRGGAASVSNSSFHFPS